MGWAKLDDRRADNAKLMAAGFAARGLDEAAICWCAGHETDGFIPETAVAMLCRAHNERTLTRLPRVLEKVGRWHRVKGPTPGWVIHDYLEYNPSRRQREAERERKRAAGSVGGRKSGEARAKQAASEPPKLNGNQVASEPANSRPVPSRPLSSSSIDVSNDARDERPDDDEGRELTPQADQLVAAVDVIARRRLEARNKAKPEDPVHTPATWLASARRGLWVELDERIASLPAEPFPTAEALADWLEPRPTPPAPRLPRYGAGDPCPTCDDNRIIVVDGAAHPCPDCRQAAAQ